MRMNSNTEEDIPDQCPVCKKKSRYLLIHINAKCKEQIDSELIEKWKMLAKIRSKKKYQAKYVEKGKHKLAQSKYVKKIKEEDKESFRKIKKLEKSRYLNKTRFQIKKIKRRSKLFKDLCISTLWFLKKGMISETELVKFQLIEDEVCRNYRDKKGRKFDPEVAHSWIRNINFKLLQSLITFHEIALVPKSIWLKALNVVSNDEGKLQLKEKLFRLIGKLQAYNSENTKDVTIPEEFKCALKSCPIAETYEEVMKFKCEVQSCARCKPTDETPDFMPDDFSEEDQVLLNFTFY